MVSKGRSNPKHKPLAVANPMRNPVYDPGPMDTAMADKQANLRSQCSIN
jgi:hypothetical protein